MEGKPCLIWYDRKEKVNFAERAIVRSYICKLLSTALWYAESRVVLV